jgi:hypothetical protein
LTKAKEICKKYAKVAKATKAKEICKYMQNMQKVCGGKNSQSWLLTRLCHLCGGEVFALET